MPFGPSLGRESTSRSAGAAASPGAPAQETALRRCPVALRDVERTGKMPAGWRVVLGWMDGDSNHPSKGKSDVRVRNNTTERLEFRDC